MTEARFIKSIDARFPYGDVKKARKLATSALEISPGAVFAVYHELARPCRSVRAPPRGRTAILEYIEQQFVHPLSGLGAWLTRKAIAKEQLSVDRAAAAARLIAEYPGSYGVLNIAYFLCDDRRGKNEELFESIRRRWEKTPN